MKIIKILVLQVVFLSTLVVAETEYEYFWLRACNSEIYKDFGKETCALILSPVFEKTKYASIADREDTFSEYAYRKYSKGFAHRIYVNGYPRIDRPGNNADEGNQVFDTLENANKFLNIMKHDYENVKYKLTKYIDYTHVKVIEDDEWKPKYNK